MNHRRARGDAWWRHFTTLFHKRYARRLTPAFLRQAFRDSDTLDEIIRRIEIEMDLVDEENLALRNTFKALKKDLLSITNQQGSMTSVVSCIDQAYNSLETRIFTSQVLRMLNQQERRSFLPIEQEEAPPIPPTGDGDFNNESHPALSMREVEPDGALAIAPDMLANWSLGPDRLGYYLRETVSSFDLRERPSVHTSASSVTLRPSFHNFLQEEQYLKVPEPVTYPVVEEDQTEEVERSVFEVYVTD